MKEKEIKVSVVIPVYNVELYVESSVRSIMKQSLRDIEIIIVNDGSIDNSLNVVEKLALEDERIHLISTSNHGLSNARNLGFFNCVGKFVLFFDSDDYLEEDALELCFNKCEKNNLDFVFFDAIAFCEKESEKIDNDNFSYRRTNLYEDIVYSGKEILKKQLDTKGYRSSACLSFIKTSYLTQIRLLFYPYILHEDELFTFLLYLKASRVGLIDRTFFHRRLRNNSIMTVSYSIRNAMDYITVCRELNSYGRRIDTDSVEKKLISKDIKKILLGMLVHSKSGLQSKDYEYVKDVVSHEFKRHLDWKIRLKLRYDALFSLLLNMKRRIREYKHR